jgi:multidrug resistance protein, MATE family
MASLRVELKVVSRLSIPVVLSQLGLMAMGVVDTLMVSRLGVLELGASALGNAWQWTWMSLGIGLVMGIDPLISQAHGRGDGPSTALALQRGIVLALIASVPIMGCLVLTEPALVLLGQDAEIAATAGRYNLYKLPTVPSFLIYSALRQYLQGRTLMAPATWVIWIANVAHVLLNWGLIFGRMGLPALGIEGAALATTITTVLMVLALALWIRVFRLHDGAWRPWSRACLALAGIGQAARLGLPVGAQLSLEACAFSVSALMAGWLGREALASHQVVINMASLSFMVPLGISQGAATRVGNLIGAGDIPGMRRAVRASLLLGAGVMMFSALAFTVLRHQIPALYSQDAGVVALAAMIFPFAAAFQLSDGTQVVAGGVLRGMGRPDAAAVVNLIGYYVIALPAAYVLAFRYGHGLAGIWGALVAGLTLVAAALLIWVRRTARRPIRALEVAAQRPSEVLS